MKIFIFWDIRSCCSVKVNRHSAVHQFHLKGGRAGFLDVSFLFGSLFDSDNGGDMLLRSVE
jgi:hypothetical protein